MKSSGGEGAGQAGSGACEDEDFVNGGRGELSVDGEDKHI